MTLEQLVEKYQIPIEEVREIKKTISDYSTKVSDFEEKITALEAEKTKLSAVAGDYKKITKAFGVESVDDIISVKAGFDTLTKESGEVAKYKALAPALEGLITARKIETDKLLEKYKDNPIALSMITYNKDTDAEDFTKVSAAYDVLTKIDQLTTGKKVINESFNPFKADDYGKNVLNGQNEQKQTVPAYSLSTDRIKL